ncbi:MAG: DUF1552 domain-containing protein, partial [Deltaproteobacteria bacterium]|nr:DUF1552 domain-containing protein [Deltaproteobacteria bacterium]
MNPHSRRMFLRSAAATVSLPFLASAVPRSARADSDAPKRLLFWYAPNGIPLPRWRPSLVGAEWYRDGLPYVLEPLDTLAAKTSVISGLANSPATEGPQGGAHARGTGGFLTCHGIAFTSGADIDNGISVDQIAAGETASSTPFPSLHLGIEVPGLTSGDCSAGYACAYMHNLAWPQANMPLPNVLDPAIAFQLLFPGSGAGLSAEDAARQTLLRTSVLDYVLDEANRLHARVGFEDKLKLDQYLTAVREVEIRVGALGGGCGAGEEPLATADITLTADLMSDIQVLALQCDLTRIATFMLANSQSSRTFDFLGIPEAHHFISHHGGDPQLITWLEDIANWEVARYAYFLRALDAVIDVDGKTLLDNSAVYFSSEIQDGDDHTHTDLPTLVAGGLNGALVQGQHLDFPEG